MRIILAAAALLVAGSALDKAAAFDPYPWCAHYSGTRGGGSANCYFYTYEQCRAAVSGVGGVCNVNLFYTGPYPAYSQAPYPRQTRPQRAIR